MLSWERALLAQVYFFTSGSPWQEMVPSPPLVTMNSEPHVPQ